MSFLHPPMSTDSAGRPSDSLERLLRAFYRSEMPDPWPTLQPPVAPPAPSARSNRQRRFASSSRWALAASVALLLVGQLFLFGKFRDAGGDDSDLVFQAPTAMRPAPGAGGRRSADVIRVDFIKVEVESTVGPDGKVVPQVKKLTIQTKADNPR